MPNSALGLRLMPGKVLLLLDPKEDKIGSLYVPSTAQRVSDLATCVLHEPSAAWEDVDLTGLRVVYERWSGKEVEFFNTKYYMVDERNIHGFISKEGDNEHDGTADAGRVQGGD